MSSRRLFIIPLLMILLGSSCRKLIEDKQKDLFLSVMTGGQWHVEKYMEGTVTETDIFTGYNFQFREDGTVLGISDSATTPGSWAGDISNYSIKSNFPDAGDPLKKLNGTWKITDSQMDYVRAEMTTVQGKMILQLRKN